MAQDTFYLILGLAAGALTGLIGSGGGLLIVPALVFLFGLSQHEAQGTTLAVMVPPIGILGALEYYRSGYVKLHIAAYICVGFLLGTFFGGFLSTRISNVALQKIFGVAMLDIGLKMIFAE